MKRHDYYGFVVDVRRLRPVVVVVVASVSIVPSFYEMLTQGLSPIVVLARLAEAVALLSTLFWGLSRVLLHYARIQAKSGDSWEQGGDNTSLTSQF
ncbi:MAG TPA: hypothetical protein VMU68_11460 [Acidimicrobiales bacterium]|nr:hypothetical protein [Acidimicrobiales bacterium]